MTMTNLIAQNATFTLPPAKNSLPLRVLNWLAEFDRRYRETVKLKNMSPERLIDMSISHQS